MKRVLMLLCVVAGLSADQKCYPEGNWGPPYFYPANPADRPYKAMWTKGKSFYVHGDYGSTPWASSYYRHPDYSLDFNMPDSEPVLACRAGTVSGTQALDTACGQSSSGGNIVWISHVDSIPDSTSPRPSGWRIVQVRDKYLHLKANIPVKIGDRVQQGQLIGYCSCTGTDGPHVHFRVSMTGHKGSFPCVDPAYTFESIPVPFVESEGVGHRYDLMERGDLITSRNERYTGVEAPGADARVRGPEILAYPNPFTRSVRITAGELAGILICDVQGRIIERLIPGKAWDASAYPAGVYCARVSIGGKSFNKRLLLIK